MAAKLWLHFYLLPALIYPSVGKLLGAFIFPHGGIALDPNHFHTTDHVSKDEAWKLHEAGQAAGELARELQPDLIVLSTPHGVADRKKFLFYLNQAGSGTADTDNCNCPPCCYNASVTLDYNMSATMLDALEAKGVSVSGLTAFGPPGNTEEPFPLRWGEVIPLHFISPSKSTKAVILSIPTRRYTDDVAMIPEMLQLGNKMWSLIDKMTEKVVFVVSGDLAHRFEASGPYGYSNTSQPFDEACGKWVEEQRADHLLKTAASFVDKCYSCGYTGFVMLEGLMEAGRKTGVEWESKLLANYHPSYYGMMVATFLPHQNHRTQDTEL